MELRKIIAAAAASVIMMLLMCSCNKIDSGEEVTEPMPEVITLSTEAMGQTDYPVYAGELVFEEAPKRVVSLSPALTEIIIAAGGSESIVAVGKYCEYIPETAGLPEAGSAASPDIAAVSALAPDLVITASPMSKKDITDLRDSGTEVLVISPPGSADELYNEYLMLAALFGGNFSARTKADSAMRDFYDAFSSAGKNMGSFILIMDSNLSAATGDTFAGKLMEPFGENIAENYSDYYIPPEDILTSDPDTVFLSSSADLGDFIEQFSELSAVKNGRLFVIDTVNFERPTAKLADTAREISALPGIA